ncbi:MAG: radical SAM protein [Candidatus Margulisiibacteriota bacterium]
MPIIEPSIRPPAEAYSFLLQVTTGCSANSCTFCGAYKGKEFRRKDYSEIYRDIDEYAAVYPDTRRVFLMDGDALVLKNEKLLPILGKLYGSFPKLTRISSYANGYNITSRSDAELKELYDNKLRLIYIGLESGSQAILDSCNKKPTADEMVQAVLLADNAGIKSSVIVLLGLGGKNRSSEHVQATIAALNLMQPRYLSFLSLMLIPGTKMYADAVCGSFQELDSMELLRESHDILQGLEMKKTLFRSNHASNYLPLEGTLPNDKEKLLYMLKAALSGGISLKPEYLRGL